VLVTVGQRNRKYQFACLFGVGSPVFHVCFKMFFFRLVEVEKERRYVFDGRSFRAEGVVTIWRGGLGLGLWELRYDTHAIQGERINKKFLLAVLLYFLERKQANL